MPRLNMELQHTEMVKVLLHSDSGELNATNEAVQLSLSEICDVDLFVNGKIIEIRHESITKWIKSRKPTVKETLTMADWDLEETP